MQFLVVALAFWVALAVADDGTPGSVDSASVAGENDAVLMARVGDESITVDEFMEFLSQHPDKIEQATTTAGKAELLRNAIENKLLVKAMEREGFLTVDASDADARQLAFGQLERKHFAVPEITDAEAVRRYYDSDPEEFGIPAAVRLSQILLVVSKDAAAADVEAARKRAEAALERIESGQPFAEVAKELTENEAARARGGDVGFVWPRHFDWIRDAVDGLSVGDHTGVVRSPFGFNILRVTDRRDAVLTPFNDARAAVIQKMQVEGQAEARAAYVKQLAEEIGVSIELEELKGAYPDGIVAELGKLR